MNPSARSLDDLDRLAFRLSRVMREQYPQLGTTGFTLIDLEERLLPFRETRREMADGGTESWERAMLRLLSGERDIIASEPGLREACRQALAMPSPTLALVRTWSTSLLTMCGVESRNSATDSGVRAHLAHGCRYCGGRLPEGKRSTFCAHCGLDLTKRQCPACSTELEADWRFCVTCGRGAEPPSGPVLVGREVNGRQ
ncbi:MAG: zinc ribbon domain-containing protein [Gemmatimonas sp.]